MLSLIIITYLDSNTSTNSDTYS